MVAAGSSLGGTLFPIAARKLIEEVGYVLPNNPSYSTALMNLRQVQMDHANHRIHSAGDTHGDEPDFGSPTATETEPRTIHQFMRF